MHISIAKSLLVASLFLGASYVSHSGYEAEIAVASILEQEIKDSPQLLTQQRQHRVALVIGNSQYGEGRLANPSNDATDMAAALESLGFEVTLLLDQDLRSMESALASFSRQMRNGSIGAFYYAGHGVQVEGENYLIPLDADLSYQADVRYDALALGKIVNAMEASNSLVNIIIIDACRNDPFYRRWFSQSRTISSQRGLAPQPVPEGTIISFSTAPGRIAADGVGRNSPFTSSLLRHIRTEDLDIGIVFRRVSDDVKNATDRQQIPWYQESLSGEIFSLNPSSGVASSSSMPSQNLISSATGIDYRPLREELAVGDFQSADLVTRRLMLQVAGRESNMWLQDADLRSFRCEDLEIIDDLWFDYSEGKYGFSVQREIYQSLGGGNQYNSNIWERFGDQVGWRRNGFWKYSHELTFSERALRGHLPATWGWRYVGGIKEISSSKDLIENIPFLPSMDSCSL